MIYRKRLKLRKFEKEDIDFFQIIGKKVVVMKVLLDMFFSKSNEKSIMAEIHPMNIRSVEFL